MVLGELGDRAELGADAHTKGNPPLVRACSPTKTPSTSPPTPPERLVQPMTTALTTLTETPLVPLAPLLVACLLGRGITANLTIRIRIRLRSKRRR